MRRHYTRNAYQNLSVSEARRAQPAEYEISPETKSDTAKPNRASREQKGRKCYKCGILLKDKRRYIIDWIGSDFQAVCHECRNK